MTAQTELHADTMKAIVRRRYGSPDVIELATIERPTADDDTMVVRVRAASVNAFDWHMLRGAPFLVRTSEGFRRPKVARLGVDLAGVVESVGKNITRFRPGDAVYGQRGGAFAQVVQASEANFVPKPANLTFEEAAAVPMAGFTALQALRDAGRLRPGQRVLVNGAAGGVGTFAVQLAKVLGAHVTAVCSTRNVDLVRSIGADDVIDYTQQDFTRGGGRFDLILDVAANRSVGACVRALAPNGVLVLIGGGAGELSIIGRLIAARLRSRFGTKRVQFLMAKRSSDDLATLKELIEAGKIKPVIDRTYSLAEAAEAIRYVEHGHARGKVVISVG